MSRKSNTILGAIFFCVVGSIYLYRILEGTRPLDNARAETLLDMKLRAEINRVEVITPDGQLALAPPSVLRNVRAIDCPKKSGTIGSLPGRSHTGKRSYAAATFECLFTGESPSGIPLFFSTYVHRTDAPSVKRQTGGHAMQFLKSDRTKDLMLKLHRETRAYNRPEQAALWAELARDDIYVPADKTQISPFQKGMDEYLRRLRSQ